MDGKENVNSGPLRSGTVEILLVEDNPGDVRLTKEAFKECGHVFRLHVVDDGVKAMLFLRRQAPYAAAPTPHMVLLDLNLPKKDGKTVLAEIKKDKDLRRIPVIILTTSKAEEDILRTYDLHANCYLTKPVELEKFITMIRSLEEFWFSFVHILNEKE
ncbi:MAG: response regulator [Candidatus Raymondbacteria bacterium RifOxyA12_full_50_37]|uniref:Response regulator n=1 Tax=Candidatus Raymondbacteria bacterium RIFOXYD12_FULL_49_13 TaxID=1817890 RepID=A0A1F7F2S1_UNCRA|nr:MAG: response regulator [Candidatus Raymondbacteria bacterium RifOxyA12_full_50_37]OGJ90295.1 MAG: response regulator [Candidatus Raymondbacteria bacterium RIFOXYA2_FULL_49_16]OGJ97285.1 MAG: response regulator [Candidatus Raymondbacteria bacterium RIFOXYC2_FULL_50_21]OGK00898.1 MAG: response regulator [Candidatus Raymondbacteria bacterium RIFOXYD12_FULL_49_13]OGK02509.1 MAG: response regulator [Candidatus Raymondbacteria bacterium RifOxyB12_full_50_8]OGK06101.1 MAG: response regulator [Can